MKGENTGSVKRLFLHAMRSQRKELLVYLSLMLLGALISMSVPLCVGYVTDRLIPKSESNAILVMMFSLILGITAGLLINVTVNRTKIRIQDRKSVV